MSKIVFSKEASDEELARVTSLLSQIGLGYEFCAENQTLFITASKNSEKEIPLRRTEAAVFSQMAGVTAVVISEGG